MSKKVKFNHGKFFSEFSALEEGSNRSKIQILRTGSWSHPSYGDFSITEADLDEFIFNFNSNVIGHEICVDENHDFEHKALGWYKELIREGSGLFAIVEWNEKGMEKINSGEYKYFSPELYFSYKSSDSSQVFKNVLVGGGITNRPFFKKMQALKMSESFSSEENPLYFFDSNLMKTKFQELLAEFSAKEKLTKLEVDSITSAFNEIPEADRTPEDVQAFEKEEAKLSEGEHESPTEDKAGEGEGADDQSGEGGGEGEGSGGEDKPEGNIQASEKDSALLAKFSEDEKAALIFAMTGMTPTEIKEVQSTASKLQKEKTFSEIKTRLTTYCFSDSNKAGFLNPTQVDRLAQFMEKLPESLRPELESMFSDRLFLDPALFTEVGSREDVSSEFSVPSDTPEGITRESYVQSVIANKLFSEGKAKTKAEALSQAKKVIAEKSIQ